ncbi:serine hydrolase domain-containing protein [Chryseolinea lacunae]|uniref:Beta-lactamase family protein n=1 Tax=Chryseolinea lacunae TaxID=2801331 RepID=A0ABS1L1S0_9BACT|nr:serine hydrolase domain-containing protein [Chryseolinea lacunae]MBL0744471.1 beta-lactamase family protein [Chryseolinea lacunae]
MTKTILAILFTILISGCSKSIKSSSEAESLDSVISRFERTLKDDLAEDNIDGSISAAIVQDNKIIWSKAFGYSDRTSKTLADTSTIYRTGSITKSFTAFLLMQLVQEGVVNLNDPVETYLPEVKQLKGYSASTKITLLQLATHTSGLSREPELEDAAAGPIEHWEDKIIASIPTTSFEGQVGKNFSYSNIGYGILGLSLSRAAHKPFMELIQDRIFTALKMNASYFKVPANMSSHVAVGLNGGPEELETETPNMEHAGRGYKVPNGGIYSTPNDLAKFIMAMRGHPALLSPANLKIMQTREVSGMDNYGLGFFINKDGDLEIVNHGGAVAGYTAQLSFDRNGKFGVIIMRNYNFGETDLQARSSELLKALH